MDMNQLLFQHQIALLNASQTVLPALQHGLNDVVADYALRIRNLRAKLGGSSYPIMGCPA